MTEQEIQALQEAKEAAETSAAEAKAAAEAARAEAEKARGDLSNVVEELKDVRAKKAEAESKAQINQPNPDPTRAPDVSELVRQELSKAEQERVKAELEQAINEFRGSKTEFQSDTSGIVYEKFQKELSKFNFSDVSSKEQAKARLEEAYRFVKQTNPDSLGESTHEGTPRTPSSPRDEGGKLAQDTERTLENSGVSRETYSKLSGKYSEALNSLGFGS